MRIHRPDWTHLDLKTALRGVHTLRDQAELAQAAQKAPYKAVRKAAIERLNDPAVLAEIAKNETDKDMGMAALFRLMKVANPSQVTLGDIAQNAAAAGVREWAVRQLSDQSAVIYIAKNDGSSAVQRAALGRLTEYGILANQGILTEIAKTDEDLVVRSAAVRLLIDQNTLAGIAQDNNEHINVRMAAVSTLTDQAHLTTFAKSGIFPELRLLAAERLHDQALAQKIFTALASPRYNTLVRTGAIRHLTDGALLVQIANEEEHIARTEALCRLDEVDKSLAQKVRDGRWAHERDDTDDFYDPCAACDCDGCDETYGHGCRCS